jgi:C-terminal processing protease CtpA/Prc
MKKILIIFILLSYNSLYSQSNPDYEKISKTCELWGLIKYFHPDSPGSKFDSAFAANIPKILEAKNENDWENVLTQWLNILNDQNTKVVLEETKTTTEEYLKAEFEKDSTLIIKISGTSKLDDFYKMTDFFQSTKTKIVKSKKGIIFDLRQDVKMSQDYEGYINYYFESLNSVLSTEVVPQYKSKYYSGFRPESGNTSGGYTVNDILQNAVDKGDFEKKNQKVVWIVNRYSELPTVALSQQASGVGIIVSSTESLTDMIPLSSTYNLSETISVKFKTNNIIMPNGFQPSIDYRYSETDDPIEISKKLVSNKISLKKENSNSAKTYRNNNISYPEETYPSIGYRVLAAAKIFSVIDIFFPYYKYMDKDWRNVLTESLPEFVNAKNEIEYGLAVAKMYANINDSHGYISGNKGLLQIQGEAPASVVVDLIENRVVITQFRNDSVCHVNNINIGDIITKVNGVPVEELMKKYEIYYSHSTKEPIRQRAAWYSIRGQENQTGIFTIQDKNGKQKKVNIKWSSSYNKNFIPKYKFDTITLLNEKIGYADLTRMEASRTDEMFEKFKNTKAIIFDMRGYPKGTAWSIAPRLTDKKNVPLALFRKPEILSPNIKRGDLLSNKSYTEFIQTVASSDKWKYKGKTIMLINHQAVSQSEHTGLFFESVNNTIFIGSPTVGANGDVTRFEIPGGMFLNFSGQGVWHADGRQLQRVGLQPHVYVQPTIKGIRSGKDEVLDKAIDWINKNVK